MFSSDIEELDLDLDLGRSEDFSEIIVLPRFDWLPRVVKMLSAIDKPSVDLVASKDDNLASWFIMVGLYFLSGTVAEGFKEVGDRDSLSFSVR